MSSAWGTEYINESSTTTGGLQVQVACIEGTTEKARARPVSRQQVRSEFNRQFEALKQAVAEK